MIPSTAMDSFANSKDAAAADQEAMLIDYYATTLCDELIPMDVGYFNTYRDIVLPCTVSFTRAAVCSLTAARLSLTLPEYTEISARYFNQSLAELKHHLAVAPFDFDAYIAMYLLITQSVLLRDLKATRYFLEVSLNYITPYIGNMAALPGAPNEFEPLVLFQYFRYFDTYVMMFDPAGPVYNLDMALQTPPLDDSSYAAASTFFHDMVFNITRLSHNVRKACGPRYSGLFDIPPTSEWPEEYVQQRNEIQMALSISSFSLENLTPTYGHAIMILKLATILYLSLRLDSSQYSTHTPSADTASLLAECMEHLNQIETDPGWAVLSWSFWQLGVACDSFPEYRSVIIDRLQSVSVSYKKQQIPSIVEFLQTYWSLYDNNPHIPPRQLLNQTKASCPPLFPV